MTAPLVFSKNALMQWGSNKISDHNRGDLSVSNERIKVSKRMANGTLREYVIADKKKFSVSWTDLPHSADFTVDGFWGGREIEGFCEDNVSPFLLKITNGDGTVDQFTVIISSFSRDLKKRGAYDFWDISVEMEEV